MINELIVEFDEFLDFIFSLSIVKIFFPFIIIIIAFSLLFKTLRTILGPWDFWSLFSISSKKEVIEVDDKKNFYAVFDLEENQLTSDFSSYELADNFLREYIQKGVFLDNCYVDKIKI